MTAYVETPADHHFTAFLATITPAKALRDRELTFSREERKRQTFLRQKAAVEQKVRVERMFTREQIELAQRVLEAQKRATA